MPRTPPAAMINVYAQRLALMGFTDDEAAILIRVGRKTPQSKIGFPIMVGTGTPREVVKYCISAAGRPSKGKAKADVDALTALLARVASKES